MLNWLKRKNNESNKFSINIICKVQHPEFFDDEKIYKNLEVYFSAYFNHTPINKAHFDGIRMFQFGGSFPLADHCIIQYIFDEKVIQFLDNQKSEIMKNELSKITGTESSQIRFEYLTFSENQKGIGSAKELLSKLNHNQSENDEFNQAINKSYKALHELEMVRKNEQSHIGNAYDELRERGLTDQKWDQMIDDLEEEKRKQQSIFNQMINVSEKSYVFSEKVNQVQKELEEYNLKCEEKFTSIRKLYGNLTEKGFKLDELINEYEEKSRNELARFNQIKYEYKDFYINDEKIHTSLLGTEKIRMQFTIDIPHHMRALLILKANSGTDSKAYKDLLEMTQFKIDQVIELENNIKKRKKW